MHEVRQLVNNPAHRIRNAQPQRKFQKAAYNHLLQLQPGNAEFRIRHKLERWQLTDSVSLAARRGVSRLRIASVLFSTLWNSWCACRRFHSQGPCLFGCGPLAQDSIEHYARCLVQVSFARSQLLLPHQHTGNLQSFMLLDANLSSDMQTMLLLNLYATYTARNILQHHGHYHIHNYNDCL